MNGFPMLTETCYCDELDQTDKPIFYMTHKAIFLTSHDTHYKNHLRLCGKCARLYRGAGWKLITKDEYDVLEIMMV
jgi:hypothetical protein